MLISAYQNYMGDYSSQLMNTLKKEGKEIYPLKVSSGEISIDTMINDELYYLTPLDILLISSEYNIPIVIILEYKNIDTLLVLDKYVDNDKYYSYIFNSKDKLSLIKTNIGYTLYKVITKDRFLQNIKSQNVSLIDYIQS